MTMTKRCVIALAAFALACGTEPEDVEINEAFIGNWEATSFVVDGEELINGDGSFFFVLGFFSDGFYSVSVGGDTDGLICDVPPSCMFDGDYSFSSSVFTLDPGTVDELRLNYSLAGDVLTVSGTFEGAAFSATFERLST